MSLNSSQALDYLYPPSAQNAGGGSLPFDEDPTGGRRRSGRVLFTPAFCLGLIVLFAGSLALHLVHQFMCDHAYVTFAFDGRHYLNTCRAITGAIITLRQGNILEFLSTVRGADFTKAIVFDGPIIPGIPALFFAALKRLPAEADWTYFAVYQGLLASFSAVAVAWITGLLTGRKSAALFAGALFTLYPSTLIASGIYRSEVLSMALMLPFLLALYKAPQSRICTFLAAVLGGIFAMVKPGMIPVIGLLCLFVGLHARRTGKIKLLFGLALTGALTIAPWALYTAIDCGKLSITAERLPSYNAAVGTDISADGWCTMPETAYVARMKDAKSPAQVFINQWKESPLPLARLTMRRVSRLWGNPWNDFREPIFGISLGAQQAIHLIIVALGFMGLGLYTVFPPADLVDDDDDEDNSKKNSRGPGDKRLLGNLVAICLLGHLSFTLFQTMGRYGYPSMPLLVVFAAYGLAVMARHAQTIRRDHNFMIKTPMALTFKVYAAAFVGLTAGLLLVNLDSFTHMGESLESARILHPSDALGRSFEIAAGDLQENARAAGAPQAMLILIDCESAEADRNIAPDALRVRLNGHDLESPLLPLDCLNGRNYYLFDTMAEHAAFMRSQVQNMRQWRAVYVPSDCQWLSKGGLNEIEVINVSAGDIKVAADLPGRLALRLPSPDYFASDRMLFELANNESRIDVLEPAETSSDSSYVKVATESGAPAQPEHIDETPRIRLMLISPDKVEKAGTSLIEPPTAGLFAGQAKNESGASVSADLTSDKFHWFARGKDGLHLNKAVLKGVGAVSTDVELASLKGESATQVQVEITGQARANHKAGRFGVSAALTSRSGVIQGLGQIPDAVLVPQKDQWQSFTLTDVVPLTRLGGLKNLDKLSVSFLPCSRLESCYGPGKQCSDIDLKDLRVKVKNLNLTDLAGRETTVY